MEKLIARGQITILKQDDSYTIKESQNHFVFSSDWRGIIQEPAFFRVYYTVWQGETEIKDFEIEYSYKPPGFSSIQYNFVDKHLTGIIQAYTEDLADNGLIPITVRVGNEVYNTSITWAKVKEGAPGVDANMLDWVKDWDTNKTMIGSDSVITPKIFAGVKNSNGTLTGTALGNFSLSTLSSSGNIINEIIDGIYGFKDGHKTFFVDNTGNAQIGRENQYIKYNSTTGKVEFGSDVVLNWTSAIDKSKTDNYGYPFYEKIIVYGDPDKYYPVIIKGGNQYVKREIFIKRAYNEQAPSEWREDVYRGTLNVLIRANFGGWGGTKYSWEIYDLTESYLNTFAGAKLCGYSMMFAVFLRGGGETGALYHLYSDQSLTSKVYSDPPVSQQVPQIAYNEDLIFYSSETYQAYAPAPRKLTESVKEEIRKKTFISLSQESDQTLSEHPLTYISSTGIYTGTLQANQIIAGKISASLIDVESLKSQLITADNINALELNSTRGKIGGWEIDNDAIYRGAKLNIGNGFTSSAESITLGSAGLRGYTWVFQNDGAAKLANGNISWDSAGNVTFGPSVKLNWTNYTDSQIDSLQVGGRNYAQNTSSEWKSPYTLSNINNEWIFSTKALSDAWEIGDIITVSFLYKYEDLKADGENSYFVSVQAPGDVTSYYPSFEEYVFTDKLDLEKGSGIISICFSGTITEERAKNNSFNFNLRHNYLSGKVTIKEFKVEKGNKKTDWSPAPEDIQSRLTKIDSSGIYTGTLDAAQITAGKISVERLDADLLKSHIINTDYINGLSCTFVQGKIGGWDITDEGISAGNIGALGSHSIQIRSTSTGSGYWYNGSYKPYGISLLWNLNENAGHFVFGEVALNHAASKVSYIGIQMMDKNNNEYFCLSTNYASSSPNDVYNRIAGWAFDSKQIWKNNVSLGEDGTISNGIKWSFNNDGSGQIASGNISWDSTGAVTFSSAVSLKWQSDIETATENVKEIARALGNGKMLYRYPEFYAYDQISTNSMQIYGSGIYMVKPDPDADAPNTSGVITRLQISSHSSGYSYKRIAFVSFPTYAKNNGRFVTRFIAKFPSGMKLENEPDLASSFIKTTWLTSQYGTGKYEEYLCQISCEKNVSSKIITQFYIKDENTSTTFPVFIDIAFATVYDMGAVDRLTTTIDINGIYTGTLTATQINAVNIDAGSIKTGYLHADRISAGTLNGNKITAGTITATQINVSSIQSSVVTATAINGLSCTFIRGKIGNWTITSVAICSGNVYNNSSGTFHSTAGAMTLGSNGIRGNKWRFEHDGSGAIAGGNISWDTTGKLSLSASALITWQQPAAEIAAGMAYGKMLYRHPEFVTSTGASTSNSTSTYLSNITRHFYTMPSAPTTKRMVMILIGLDWNTPTDKRVAGFGFGTPSRANAKFITRMIAQIPVGRTLNVYHNSYGTGGKTTWLTSQEGTGKYEEYICVVECGSSGTFDSINYFALTGGDTPTTGKPCQWLVVYATVFDVTATEGYLTTINADGIYTGSIQANQITVDSALVVGGITYNGSISVRDSSNVVKVTLNRSGITAIGGTIGGWTISSSQISRNSVTLGSDGSITNGTRWKLNNDGSGQLANGNISWGTDGTTKINGEITATSGKIANFTISSNYIGAPASGSGGGGSLSINNDLIRVGNTTTYVLLGHNTFPSNTTTVSAARVSNNRSSTDFYNYGIFIDVAKGKRNFGVASTAPLIAPCYIANRIQTLSFNGGTSTVDFSQSNLFFVYGTSSVSVTLPNETAVTLMFGASTLSTDFAFIFTFIYNYNHSNSITLQNIRNFSGGISSYKLSKGNAITLLCAKYPSFHYQVLNYHT